MKRHAAELITRDPERFFHHDRVFLNNPVVMQGMGLAPLVVQDIFSIIQEINRQGVTILLVEQITTIDKMVLCNRLCRVTSARKKQEIEAAVKKQFAMQACMGREAQA